MQNISLFYMRCTYRKCIQERTTTLHRIIFRIFIFVLVSFSCETWGRRFPVLILLCRTWGKKTCNTHNIFTICLVFVGHTPHTRGRLEAWGWWHAFYTEWSAVCTVQLQIFSMHKSNNTLYMESAYIFP